jgi:hypothetical protein
MVAATPHVLGESSSEYGMYQPPAISRRIGKQRTGINPFTREPTVFIAFRTVCDTGNALRHRRPEIASSHNMVSREGGRLTLACQFVLVTCQRRAHPIEIHIPRNCAYVACVDGPNQHGQFIQRPSHVADPDQADNNEGNYCLAHRIVPRVSLPGHIGEVGTCIAASRPRGDVTPAVTALCPSLWPSQVRSVSAYGTAASKPLSVKVPAPSVALAFGRHHPSREYSEFARG